MPDFPAAPVAPSEFMQEFLAQALREADALRASVTGLDARLGVKLTGAAGGEWVIHLKDGDIELRSEPREDAAFTLVQSVEDWRGALWEGRGGVIGRYAAALFRPGDGLPSAGPGSPPSPAALARMRDLDGVIRIVVTGGDADWCVDFKLGPGALPEAPSATLTLSEEDARTLEETAVDERASLLLQLFMAGRIQVDGDMALVMQMQAAQLQAESPQP